MYYLFHSFVISSWHCRSCLYRDRGVGFASCICISFLWVLQFPPTEMQVTFEEIGEYKVVLCH